MSSWPRVKSNAAIINVARAVECAEEVKARDRVLLSFEHGGSLHVHKVRGLTSTECSQQLAHSS